MTAPDNLDEEKAEGSRKIVEHELEKAPEGKEAREAEKKQGGKDEGPKG
ncbi:hypothetical protein SAMN05216548_105118 [Faunimonas pinastri]|uniref:Uncharacterized protein n=1 Tax=Faunimonas pinastri TaxID=1855383 RepID=A0A1H9GQP4_9HYPH|nr:hypothetical protein [Faunimonas pinastri]SEQ52364.1 hypothetical protein SAMN05216548_105118 [Faunimonas pinastri]